MIKISQSPNRCTFQKESYIKRCQEEGKEILQEYLDMFDEDRNRHDHKFDTQESRVNNLEFDLLTTEWILEKARNNDVYAQNLYAAMCNNEFVKNDVWPILKEEKWGCSWRYAGGIVADMQQQGDYIDWYCSGMRDVRNIDDDEFQQMSKEQQENFIKAKNYVGESVVTDEIRADLLKLGWIVIDDEPEAY